jgi:hypothetical protein
MIVETGVCLLSGYWCLDAAASALVIVSPLIIISLITVVVLFCTVGICYKCCVKETEDDTSDYGEWVI